jgi:hypothetical protein
MTTKKTQPKEAVAMAKFTTTGVKPELVSGATQKVGDLVKQNPAYGQHPEIQQGLTTWQGAADAVDQTSQKIKAAHLTLTALIATLAPQVAAWKRSAHAMVALINTACAGSASAIQQWGFAVSTRNVLATTTDAPTGLRVAYTKALVMSVRWGGVAGHLGLPARDRRRDADGLGRVDPVPARDLPPAGHRARAEGGLPRGRAAEERRQRLVGRAGRHRPLSPPRHTPRSASNAPGRGSVTARRAPSS